jgi:hypothetical protein
VLPILSPELNAQFPQQLKDLLQWHIKAHGDNLVSVHVRGAPGRVLSSSSAAAAAL